MSAPAGCNPFVGLRPFEREDSLLYFGRGDQVQTLLERLSQARFLAVVGSSGCGKSSLIRAGLIPALEGGFLVQDRDRWRIAAMKPGEAPVRHLAAALLQLADAPGAGEAPGGPPRDQGGAGRSPAQDLAVRLYDDGADAALDVLKGASGAAETNLLLLVDQFEELFRLGLNRGDPKARDEAEAFAALLLRLAGQDRLPIYVCITMRSDFLGDCDAFIGLPEAINAGQFLVPRLTRAQRCAAIEGPIRLAGGEIAPRLVDRLLNEGLGTRDDLPILQHLLMRVWDAWALAPERPLDLSHYEQVQTLHRALDRHAEEAMEELTPADRLLARRLFQALTELDSGNRCIRRPARLSEVAAVAEVPVGRIMHVIEGFRSQGRNFLVLSSEDPADDPLIDISHESLIRQWQSLRGWVDEEAATAKLYRRLAETADLHAEGKAGLYRDADLEQALAWKPGWRGIPGGSPTARRNSRRMRGNGRRMSDNGRRLSSSPPASTWPRPTRRRQSAFSTNRKNSAAPRTIGKRCSRPFRPSANRSAEGRACSPSRAIDWVPGRWSAPLRSAGNRRARTSAARLELALPPQRLLSRPGGDHRRPPCAGHREWQPAGDAHLQHPPPPRPAAPRQGQARSGPRLARRAGAAPEA